MVRKNIITLSLISSLMLSIGLSAKLKPIELQTIDKEIAQYVTRMMEAYHYSQAKLDNDMSQKIFNEFFSYLDNNRRIFLEEDIEEFRVYADLLDEMLKKGDLTFPLKVFKRYVDRLEERVKFIEARLNEPFDFTVMEDYQIDRENAPWAKTSQELDDLWRKHLKNELILFELRDIAEKEHSKKTDNESSNKKDEKTSEEPHKKITPQETILKRYKKFLKLQEETTREGFLELALNVVTRCFDPHSSYFGAKSQEEFEISMKLSLIGIGATLMEDDGYTKITSLVPGGPASEGKQLREGDRIIAVAQGDEEPVDAIDMNLSKVVGMIRGKKGTEVRLHVVRGGVNGSKHIISIIRDEIKLTESEAKGEIKEVKIDENTTRKVGVIHLPSFYADWDAQREGKEGKSSTADVRRILQEQMKQGIDSVIIDLRSNGGGSLPEAISLTGLFIDQGPVVQIREGSGRVGVRNDEDPGAIWTGPLLVLVNEGSASASEIFAAAIQDYKRGVIAGTYRTHGKGTVQQVQGLENLGSFRNREDVKPGQVKYTMAKFYRINGGSTQNKGVVPDIILPSYGEFDDHGESTLKHVLAWDEIKNLNVKQDEQLKMFLPELQKRSLERRQNSQDFKDFIADINYFKSRLEIKTLSLNKEVRVAEFIKDKEIRDAREKLMKKLFAIDTDENGEEKFPETHKIADDIYLREAMMVVSDLQKLMKEQAAVK